MFKEKLEQLLIMSKELSEEQKNFLHINSLKNFFIFYEQIHGRKEKEEVYVILNTYWELLVDNDFRISKELSKEAGRNFIMKAGHHYSYQLGFKVTMGLKGSIFVGIILDICLLAFGILKTLYFIPLSTVIMIGIHKVKMVTYGKKNKLYGPRY